MDTLPNIEQPAPTQTVTFETEKDHKDREKVVVKTDKPVTKSTANLTFAYRHYYTLHSTCNKLLARRWDTRVRQRHRRRVRLAIPDVDNSSPKIYPHLEVRLKRIQLEEERNFEIKHQNEILMNRIGFQMAKKSKFPPVKQRPYDPKRMRDLKRIEKENTVIAQRLDEKRPFYCKEDWILERRRNLQYLSNLAQYPGTYYKDIAEFDQGLEKNPTLRDYARLHAQKFNLVSKSISLRPTPSTSKPQIGEKTITNNIEAPKSAPVLVPVASPAKKPAPAKKAPAPIEAKKEVHAPKIVEAPAKSVAKPAAKPIAKPVAAKPVLARPKAAPVALVEKDHPEKRLPKAGSIEEKIKEKSNEKLAVAPPAEVEKAKSLEKIAKSIEKSLEKVAEHIEKVKSVKSLKSIEKIDAPAEEAINA